MNNDPVIRQLILENYQHPFNNYKPDRFDFSCSLSNPNCGDEITVYISVKNQFIELINYEISACALSTATASLLAQELTGKSAKEIQNLDQEYLNQLFQTELSMNRIKCALLPLRAIQQALGLREIQQYL